MTAHSAPRPGQGDPGCALWLAEAADALDTSADHAADVLPRLAAAGLPAIGVPTARGGAGGTIVDALDALSEVATRSLAAAFVLWGHRTYIEYLLQSPNTALGDEALPGLLDGTLAGATGLSNAMKHLAGMEPLQVVARRDDAGLRVDGALPWVTNLRREGFHVAAAVDGPDGVPVVAAFAHDDAGLARSADLDLMGMRATNTAALSLNAVRIGPQRIIAADARAWLPRVRPAFAGLQCGMSIGLARRALAETRAAGGSGRGVLAAPLADATQRLEAAQSALFAGLRARAFEANAAPLFELRIALAEVVAEAVSLELQALGGKAYLTGPGRGFARRSREAAFIPVITPSLVQLKTALAKARESAA
ncbi:acyl-CoA dehydrogenase family protein [Azorhizobium doebereinerae]|uniref:acyl-CoA dehydrogenase family protein n=1 Tax=Azorhizobium doebereinerae TaxID=281091 RepID=UPI0004103C31|nr:acyl-CoA dehydrogenase family protein [Azorhizobium doebereinerae]